MPLLELRDVEARYGAIRALHGVSLAVEEGEVVSLLGANGAGKTTTLRAISGAVRKTGGITFDGKSIAKHAPESVARLGVAHVPEGRGLFAELTVWDNLRMGAYVRGERKTFKQEAPRVLGYFPWLEARKHQQAGTLSGGEQQMLSLARALVSRPRLLMLDEPVAGLSAAEADHVRDTIRRVRDRGISLVVIDHNMRFMANLCERILVVHHGQELAHGTPQEVLTHPAVIEAYLGRKYVRA